MWLLLPSQRAVENGAKGVREPWEESDEHGSVVMATVQTVCNKHTTLLLFMLAVTMSCSMGIPHIRLWRG